MMRILCVLIVIAGGACGATASNHSTAIDLDQCTALARDEMAHKDAGVLDQCIKLVSDRYGTASSLAERDRLGRLLELLDEKRRSSAGSAHEMNDTLCAGNPLAKGCQ